MQNHAIKTAGHMGKMGLGYNAQKYFISNILKKILKNDNSFTYFMLNGYEKHKYHNKYDIFILKKMKFACGSMIHKGCSL